MTIKKLQSRKVDPGSREVVESAIERSKGGSAATSSWDRAPPVDRHVPKWEKRGEEKRRPDPR